MSQATCFVVQGFGKKTDYTDGRVLDLDASYAVIKEAVEGAGLKCLRADEIPHSGVIDLPMYEMLLEADLVVADLSTYNVNAAFELGVRYGLRTGATIIVAEDQFKNPFDVGHIVIRRYKHLGEDLGVKEAKRFCDDLSAAIKELMARRQADSPVYTFLPDLRPPRREALPVPPRAGFDSGATGAWAAAARAAQASAETSLNVNAPTAKKLLETALAAMNPPAGQASDFPAACRYLKEVRRLRPNDAFVVQQLALATYKSKLPTPEAALLEARQVMHDLGPATTNDPETLGLWGAVHKRLWELRSQPDDLAEAVAGYERGFHLKQDWYNGINLAFLLDLRSLEYLMAGEQHEAIADAVQARRVRREVIRLATPLAERADDDPQKRFWVVATLWEAAIGLGDAAAQARWEAAANTLAVPQWMQDSRRDQGSKLTEVLANYATMLSGQ